tara:strand:+ start:246 stop:470 length:225 start_codon:yes stop_codon:yes gene_type:complete
MENTQLNNTKRWKAYLEKMIEYQNHKNPSNTSFISLNGYIVPLLSMKNTYSPDKFRKLKKMDNTVTKDGKNLLL